MKRIFLILLCLFFVMGCAGLQVKRGVKDNIFFSSLKPKLNIKINSEFQYLEKKAGGSSSFVDNSLRSAGSKIESYSFKNPNNNRTINIIINQITENRVYWKTFDFKSVKNVIDAGTVTIRGNNYQYGVFPSINNQECYLLKILSRISGGGGQTKILIYYAEKLGDEKECSGWENPAIMTNDQKKHLTSFLEDFKNDIKILDYSEIIH